MAEHVQTATSDFYKWTHRPGARWDKLDALAYARAVLATMGLTASGGYEQPKARKRYSQKDLTR
jgi:hypothetical protein